MATGCVVSVTRQTAGGHGLAEEWFKVLFCMAIGTTKDVYIVLFA